VASCEPCSRAKTKRHKEYGLLKSLPIPSRPFESINMDRITHLPLSSGHDAILVIVDRFTKFALFIPVWDDINGEEMSELLLSRVVAKYGVPTSIVSDRGYEFTGSVWRATLQRLGTESSLTTSHNPRANGGAERVNQTIEAYLRLFGSYAQDDWAEHLPLAEYSYNSARHSATGQSPFRALMGYEPQWSASTPAVESDRSMSFNEMRQEVTRALEHSQEQAQRSFDRKHPPAPVYAVGDRVWLDARNVKAQGQTKKLDQRYMGPFAVSEVISSHAYRLALPASMRIHSVFHVRLLEPVTQNRWSNRAQPPPPPTIVEGEEEYEVEAIVGERTHHGHKQFRVQWRGYSGEDALSWEWADDLEHCEEATAAYVARRSGNNGRTLRSHRRS